MMNNITLYCNSVKVDVVRNQKIEVYLEGVNSNNLIKYISPNTFINSFKSDDILDCYDPDLIHEYLNNKKKDNLTIHTGNTYQS